MEVAQNRGLTICPIDGLSDSDDETPEDLALSTSMHLREGSFIDFVQRNSSGTQVKSSQVSLIYFFMQLQKIYYLQGCYSQN